MEYTILNNGVKMPLLGLGTWDLRGEECIRIVVNAIEAGYRMIDTAQMYNNEVEVGKGISQSMIDRKELFITTKLYRISNSYKKAKYAIEQSLMNLKLDYIDLVLLHEPYVDGSQMYKALEDAYQQGKIRAIGVSNYDQKWFERIIKECSVLPAVNQVEAHIYYQKWELQEYLNINHTAMQAWAPLIQGKEDIMHISQLKVLAEKYHKTVPQIILRWLTQRGTSVVPKSKRLMKLIENINIFDFQLLDIEIQELRKLDKNETLFPWTLDF